MDKMNIFNYYKNKFPYCIVKYENVFHWLSLFGESEISNKMNILKIKKTFSVKTTNSSKTFHNYNVS